MAIDLTAPHIKVAIEFWTDPTIRRVFGFDWFPDHKGTYFLLTPGTRLICEYSQEEVNFVKAHLLVAHAFT